MPNPALSFQRDGTPPVKKTARAMDCDPECKYKSLARELEEQREKDRYELETKVMLGDYGTPNLDNVDTQEDVDLYSEYKGLSLMAVVGDQCIMACGIERLIAEGQIEFGKTVQTAINNIKE